MSDAVRVPIEGTLWKPEALWQAAVEHLSQRFGRVRSLDVDRVVQRLRDDSLAASVSELRQWAGDDINLEGALGRYFDEHLPMHVRPQRALNQRIRTLRAEGQVLHAVTALPAAPAHSLLRHLGLAREFSVVHADADEVEPPAQLM